MKQSDAMNAPIPVDTHSIVFLEAPVHGVFVDTNGSLLLHKPTHGATQRLLNYLEHAPSDFQLSVGSTPVKTLADTKDLIDLFASGAEKQLLVYASQAIGLIAGGVGFVLAALPMLGLLKEPNEFDALYDRLQLSLRELTAKTLAASWLDSMQEIHSYVGHAVTSAGIAAKKISGKSVSANQLDTADYWSQYAVQTLAGDALWKRVYDTALIHDGGYLPVLDHSPEVVSGLVFDYRLALPAYLKALGARLVVIDAIAPTHTKWGTYADEIKGHVATLKSIELRIRTGLAKTVPSKHHKSNWHITAASSGAYDLHTGAHNIVNFHPSLSFSDPIDLIAIGGKYPTTFEEFEAQCNYATDLRFWRLYNDLGLFEFWRLISDVESLAGPRHIGLAESEQPYYERERRGLGVARLSQLVAPKSEQGQKLKAAFFERHEEHILHRHGLKLQRRRD